MSESSGYGPVKPMAVSMADHALGEAAASMINFQIGMKSADKDTVYLVVKKARDLTVRLAELHTGERRVGLEELISLADICAWSSVIASGLLPGDERRFSLYTVVYDEILNALKEAM
jgi:hypothetical protein